MGEFLAGLVILVAIIFFGAYSNYSGYESAKEQIITNKGLCIFSKVNGVEFKKCYELTEKKP